MTDRELKKLDKTELLEILIDLSDENEALRKENAALKAKLDAVMEQPPQREVFEQAPSAIQPMPNQEIGSIAEVAVRVNGVFEAAQAAADQYLSTIRAMNANKDEEYRRIIKKAMFQANEIVKEAEQVSAKKIADAEACCKTMIERYSSIIK